MYCHNALCLFVVECTYVAIKRETEQFVRAVAQRFPGQEAPVSSIAQYVCESSTKCCHFINSLGPNQFSGTIICGVCNWSRFVVKGWFTYTEFYIYDYYNCMNVPTPECLKVPDQFVVFSLSLSPSPLSLSLLQPTLGESPWASAKQQQQQQPDQSSRTGRVAPTISDSGPTKRGATSGASNPGFGGLLEGHYAECYPGMAEEYDATYDSDDEADYTKMDMVGVASLP